jgi:hypothetical protein
MNRDANPGAVREREEFGSHAPPLKDTGRNSHEKHRIVPGTFQVSGED